MALTSTEATLETQCGYDDYLKHRPSPEATAFRTAVIEAEAIGTKALGKEYRKYAQVLALKTSNTYRGQIVGQNDFFVIQQVSPLNTVRHLKHDLPHVPQIGEKVRIAYSAGICRIDRNLRHVRKRTHRISL
jgi:hypothetical protein